MFVQLFWTRVYVSAVHYLVESLGKHHVYPRLHPVSYEEIHGSILETSECCYSPHATDLMWQTRSVLEISQNIADYYGATFDIIC